MGIEISPQTPTQIVLNLASKNQEALQLVSKQIASGTKHDSFKGYAEDSTTEQFLTFNSTLTEIGAYLSSNTTAVARAKAMDSSIAEIQNIATDLAGLITQRRNAASGTNVPLEVEATGILDKIAGKLNIKFDGRFLFSGSKTDTKPIADIQLSNLGTNSTATTSYYSGDNDIASVRSSDSERVEYGVLASDDGFKNLIGAAHLAISGNSNDDDTVLAQAMDMVNNAIDQITTSRATVGIAIERLNKSTTAHNDFKLLVQNNLNDISQTDIIQATSKMSELQAIVQAGYLAFSRLSNLRLTNYLQ